MYRFELLTFKAQLMSHDRRETPGSRDEIIFMVEKRRGGKCVFFQ